MRTIHARWLEVASHCSSRLLVGTAAESPEHVIWLQAAAGSVSPTRCECNLRRGQGVASAVAQARTPSDHVTVHARTWFLRVFRAVGLIP